MSETLVGEGYGIGLVCAVVGLAPSSYYRPAAPEADEPLKAALKKAAGEWPTYGYRRLTQQLAREGTRANTKKVRRLMAELGLQGKKPAKKVGTTDSRHDFPRYPNRMADLAVTCPDQVWVADITYIRTEADFMYLGLITDRWSRKIVGYHLGETLAAEEVLKALAMALKGLPEAARPIHHSDRGCQYASHAYVAAVKKAGLTMSMTEKNHSAENAIAERVNGILKQEYWLDANFEDRQQARQATTHGIRLYNTRRPHTALKFATPEQVHHADQN